MADYTTDEDFDVSVERLDDEEGGLRVTIKLDDDEITIDAGRFHENACNLKAAFTAAAQEVEKDILKDWEDRPDETDGWVYEHGSRYTVSLEGAPWDGSILEAHNPRSNARAREFPTRTIAVIELARAMTARGCFPNVWFMGDRGHVENIYEEIRPYHDDGGTDLSPLPGVEYTADQEDVVFQYRYTGMMASDRDPFDDEYWTSVDIVQDYGDAGIEYCYSGDDELHWSDDRKRFATEDEFQLRKYRQYLIEFFSYRNKLIGAMK